MFIEALTIFVITVKVACLNPFCKFNCGQAHTACYRFPCHIDPTQCGTKGEEFILNNDDKIFISEHHNTLRNLVASGRVLINDSSQASNMHTISYDDELGYVAQCWANSCIEGVDLCRSTSKFRRVGQNIFMTRAPSNLTSSKEYLRYIFNIWFAQQENTTRSIINKFNFEKSAHVKEYTQIVWAKTTHVGCGRAKFKGYLSLVCNYGPSGNIKNAPVYKRGTPCSLCKEKRCNNHYPALCGDTESFKEYKASFSSGARCTFLSSYFMFFLLNTINQ